MEKFVGLGEDPTGSNHVADITGWWGKGNMAWCAITVSKAYLLAGSKSFARGNRYQYVPTIVSDARQARNGLAVTLAPKPGDLVCYDWDGSNFATGDNHVGMFSQDCRELQDDRGQHLLTLRQPHPDVEVRPWIVFVHVSN
jgi:hypothetical protein